MRRWLKMRMGKDWHVLLWQSQRVSWHWCIIRATKFEKHFFFRPGYGCRWWLWAFVPPFVFWRDNNHTMIGLGAFKRAIVLDWHQ